MASLMGPGTKRGMAGTEPDSGTLIFMLLDEVCDHGIESAVVMAMVNDPREAKQSDFATMPRLSHPFILRFLSDKTRTDTNAHNAPPGFQWERGVVNQDVRYDPGQFAPDELADQYYEHYKSLCLWALSSIIRQVFTTVLDAFNDERIPPDARSVDVRKHGGLCDVCGAGASNRCGGCKMIYYCSKKCQLAGFPEHKKICRSSRSSKSKKSHK